MLYKKYPKYKSSGIEWLGEIPEHWEVRKLKYISNFTIGFTPPTNKSQYYENGKYTWITITDMDKKFIKDSKQKISENAIKEFKPTLIPKNSLLFSFKLSVGKVAFVTKDVYINEAILALFPNINIDLNFYYYVLPSQLIKNANENIYGAKILNQELLKNAFLVFPPLSEQKAIASFLDKATAKIDNLIQKEEKLIKLLEEKKEALITKVVTKGLKKVKLKNSGVEWLEEIPEHWEVRRLRYVAKIINGSTPSSKVDEYWNGNIIWITPKDFTKNKYLENSERKITKLGLQNCGAELVPKNSIIITTRAPIGNVAIAKQPLCTNQGCKSIIPLSIMTNYLYYYFTIISSVLNSLGTGTTFMELSSETLKDLSIPLPPLQEQKEIAEYLDKKLAQIDKLIQKSKKAIELLKEKKQALITNAVTGKIDVRENYEA